MSITSVQLTVSGVLFLSTFLCSTLPIFLFSWMKTRSKSNSSRSQYSLFSFNTFVSCVTCFGGGIFLGACLLDLLPDVIHHVNKTIKTEFQYDNETLKRYPIAELLIGFGLFLVLFIEQTILSCRAWTVHAETDVPKKPTIIMSNEDEETAMINMHDQDPLIDSSVPPVQHRFDISERKEDPTSSKNRLIITRNFMLVLTLIIHSIFEGIALGSTDSKTSFFELFFAIIIHKSIIAFSVGLKLMNFTRKRLTYAACFLFSIATPLGMFLIIAMQEFLPKSRHATVVHEILRAFACGTFFYITFFDVLPHELNISTNHRHASSSSSVTSQYRLLKVICIFIGFSCIAALSFVMK